jgi:hypothetical protein
MRATGGVGGRTNAWVGAAASKPKYMLYNPGYGHVIGGCAFDECAVAQRRLSYGSQCLLVAISRPILIKYGTGMIRI